MIISYEEFCELLSKHIQSGDEFYLNLLKNVIDNPSRYCGLFRLSNAKSKLIQNVTQSKEIKFGDIVEELATEYIERLGYKTFNKNLGADEKGDFLNVDQYFTDGTNIYIVEMKIRDDHDSTKKRGQYSNFQKKIKLVRKLNPTAHIDASMWFVDDSLVKNKNYYKEMMQSDDFMNCTLHLYYGSEFFHSLKNGDNAWAEFIQILTQYRVDNSNVDVDIPDFASSKEMLDCLVNLPNKYWNKLNSSLPQYVLLRKELFGAGDNIEKAKALRNS